MCVGSSKISTASCLLRLWALCLQCWLQLAFAVGLLVHGSWAGTLKWSQLALVCSAVVPRQLMLPRKDLEYCRMCNVWLPTFSSLNEPTSSFFPHFFHCWGMQVRSSSSRWRGLEGCQQTSAQGGHGIREPRYWDAASVTGSSVTTNSSGNCPLFPVHCFLNHWLCKTIAELDSQKCSEALGVKYCDKRRHSSSLLHRTF